MRIYFHMNNQMILSDRFEFSVNNPPRSADWPTFSCQKYLHNSIVDEYET